MKRAKNIKISVIMGVYNPTQKQQLFAAVRSIIGQTFPWWEMIIYDDGSSPDYAETIREAAALDDRIVYMRENRNRGLAYALNQCIMKSRGKYIARMDADDISKPDRLEKLYDFLENHIEYAWVGSNSELFNDSGRLGYRPESQDSSEQGFPAVFAVYPSGSGIQKKCFDRKSGL